MNDARINQLVRQGYDAIAKGALVLCDENGIEIDRHDSAQVEAFDAAIRRELKSAFGQLMDEGKDLISVGMGAWTGELARALFADASVRVFQSIKGSK